LLSRAGVDSTHDATSPVAGIAFAVIGVGALGCLVGGWVGDRYGKATAALIALCSSGVCCLSLAFSLSWPRWMVVAVACVWGFTVIADSAQFSALISEASDPRFVGSALTFQMAAGFLVTSASIALIPVLADRWDWRAALLALAVGPIIGVVSLAPLVLLEHSARAGSGRGLSDAQR